MTLKQFFIASMFMIMSTAFSLSAQTELKSGIEQNNLDKSVHPADDFYQYACGGWMKNNPLPAAYARYGTFDLLADNNTKRLRDILGELERGSYAAGTDERRLSDLYRLGMDSARRNLEGVSPVAPRLEALEKANTMAALFEQQLEMEKYGRGQFMGIGFSADEKNAAMNILCVNQGGLTLGEKSYYLDDDEATKNIREAYKRYVEKMFRIYGFSEAEAHKKMLSILGTETTLARASRSRTELRDPDKNYNKMVLAEFKSRYPNILLERIMRVQGVDGKYLNDIVVGQPEFVDCVNALYGTMPPYDYRTYMEWGIINSSAPYLSDATEAAHFDFFGREKAGRKEDYPLWKRTTDQLERFMGEALGRIYVEKYFPASSKRRMQQLISRLKESLGQRIEAQSWMSGPTKRRALDKLGTFYVKVGYPDKWTDFSGLNINPKKSYYENIIECSRFWNALDIEERAGKPVDRDKWYMFPQTVNAYYNPTTNEICFPAGILQKPFFDPEADDAFNLGAIGVVIGHEMTHGFDDQGRKYDKDGNMNEWWTADDAANFQRRTTSFADFFSSIKVLPDLNGNGQLTLGENLADHGGLQVAYNALLSSMAVHPLDTINGLSPEQRFFLAYANVWADNITDKEIRNRTKTDPHALGRWRVNGALPHIDSWYDAFGVKEGDKMFLPKEERLDLW